MRISCLHTDTQGPHHPHVSAFCVQSSFQGPSRRFCCLDCSSSTGSSSFPASGIRRRLSSPPFSVRGRLSRSPGSLCQPLFFRSLFFFRAARRSSAQLVATVSGDGMRTLAPTHRHCQPIWIFFSGSIAFRHFSPVLKNARPGSNLVQLDTHRQRLPSQARSI